MQTLIIAFCLCVCVHVLLVIGSWKSARPLRVIFLSAQPLPNPTGDKLHRFSRCMDRRKFSVVENDNEQCVLPMRAAIARSQHSLRARKVMQKLRMHTVVLVFCCVLEFTTFEN